MTKPTSFVATFLRRCAHLLGLLWEVVSLPLALLRFRRGVHSGVHQALRDPKRSASTENDVGAPSKSLSPSESIRKQHIDRQHDRVRRFFAQASPDGDDSSDHLAMG